MTSENKPENQGTPEEKSLIVRSQQISLEVAANDPFLKQAGFSSELPRRLMQLNEVLLKAKPKLTEVELELIPGETPLLNTKIEYSANPRVNLRASPYKSDGSLAIEFPPHTAIFLVTIEEIKKFTNQFLPDKKIAVFSQTSSELVEPIDDLDLALEALREETLRSFLTTKPAKPHPKFPDEQRTVYPYSEFEILIENNHEYPLLVFTLLSVFYSDRIGCELKDFFYKGKTADVERVMDLLSDLLDKPRFYPFKTEKDK